MTEQSISYLHCHDDYSNLRLLDCTTSVHSLIDRAVELNATAIAITDHESLSGHVEALQYIKELYASNKTECKLLLGNEIYLVDEIKPSATGGFYCEKYYHFILIAKDAIGHKMLRQLSSIAWENSFFSGGMERVPTLKSNLEKIIRENGNHLIASTACIGGELGQNILLMNGNDLSLPFESNKDLSYEKKIQDFIGWCSSLFGSDFYLEIQPSNNPLQIMVNKQIIQLSEQHNVDIIITCDAHYKNAEQKTIHASYLNSRDEEREVGDFYDTTYNMLSSEIHEYLDKHIGFDNVVKAISNTNKVSDKVEFYDLFHTQIVPKATIPQFTLNNIFEDVYNLYPYIEKFSSSENNSDRYFLYLIEQGFLNKESCETFNKEELHLRADRINKELEAVWESSVKINDNVASYYITALELINLMWDDGELGGGSLVGASRGSIASFYIAYLIDLQQINPILYDIPYWRHLHASRPEMPDIDIDTEASKRKRIIEATANKYGLDRVLNICTFKTEGSKSSILTAARGLGINNDIAQYIANLIPVIRGNTTSLTAMVEGDEENDLLPNKQFITECNRYPNLLETAREIEGLVCGRSIHASGVIIFDSHYADHNCVMRAPSGQLITQWSMDDSTYAGGLKFDFLTITNLDSMHLCMDMLIKYGYIAWQGSLRKTYNKYFHPDVIDYDTEEMWAMAERLEIVNLFQFQTQVGSQAIKKIKPRNLIELGVANSVMRLMAPNSNDNSKTEQPIDKYVKYKNDITLWYTCMKKFYKLTQEEIVCIESYLKAVSGMATMQEEVMRLVMEEKISNFSMKEANKLRKSISKKKRKLQEEAKVMFFSKGKEIGTSDNLLNYVWNECIVPQLGYSFSLPHVLGYSTIAIQEMNMAYHYPIIYWNCANLIVDSSSDEDDLDSKQKSTNYGKIATAISNMQAQGINVTLPLINEADFGFTPDEKNNRIIFGLKGLNGIGDDVAHSLIVNRPYSSMKDFYNRMIDTKIIKPAQMIKLIKAGCFIDLDNSDRIVTMKYFIENYLFSKCEQLGVQQFNRICDLDMITDELEDQAKLLSFKKHMCSDNKVYKLYIDPQAKRALPKCGYNDRWLSLNKTELEFFMKFFSDKSIVATNGDNVIISEKLFEKEYESIIIPLKRWLENTDTLKLYNDLNFSDLYNQHASGTIPEWEMNSLSFYYTDHELKDINNEKYGIEDYFSLPTIPTIYDSYNKYVDGKLVVIPKFKISLIAGTVLDSNKNKHTITLLTTTGLVTCKYNKGQYANYNQRMTEQHNNGTKSIIEDSWFKKGNKILICGYREDDVFRVYTYFDTLWKHSTIKIESIDSNGDLILSYERKGKAEL